MPIRNLAAGIDLNRDEPQICYYNLNTGDTVTAPMKIGNEGVSFRDILDECEQQAGTEQDEDASGEQKRRRLEEQAADIFRQSLATLGLTDPARQLTGLVTTMPVLTRPLISLIRSVYKRLGLPEDKAFLQDYRESFYWHTFYQKKELRARDVCFFRFSGTDIVFYSLLQNQQTRPVTITVEESPAGKLGEDPASWDLQLREIIGKSIREHIYSSVFLMGDTFEQSLMPRSTALLCKNGRKVFVVDRLFARGACCAAREKTVESILNGYLYLGDDLVRSNISMEMIIQGSETTYPLVSAGVSWYEAGTAFECLLDGRPELRFQITGMEHGPARTVCMELDGMPERPPKTTRLEVQLSFDSPEKCRVEVKDAGFGELFPASGKTWSEELPGLA